MRKSTKGFYTLEAAVFLPLVILAVLSLGYFMRIDGMWEQCIHGAVDESALAASRAYGGGSSLAVGNQVKNRIQEDLPHLDSVKITGLRVMYSDLYADSLTAYKLEAAEQLSLPLGFQRAFHFASGIKYRGFVGKRQRSAPMGVEGLESYVAEDPVRIFPQSGERYHGEGCTYVKASVESAVLTEAVRRQYDECGLCGSGSMVTGSIVFCFKGEDTAYHRGTCSSIQRHTAVIDRTEAVRRGYTPCSKCGGG